MIRGEDYRSLSSGAGKAARVLAAFGFVWFVAQGLSALGGCASAPPRQSALNEALNVVTNIVDPLYESAVYGCDVSEGWVISRESTQEQDERDIQKIREICDRTFAAFDALRNAQIAARYASDLAKNSDNSRRLQAAWEAFESLKAAAESAKEIWGSAKSDLERIIRGER